MAQNKTSNRLFAFYDLEVSYPCFDFICFLTFAEWTRRQLGNDDLCVIFVPKREDYVDPNFDFGAQRNQWLLTNILLPCCALLPPCKSIMVCGSREEAQEIFNRIDKFVFPNGYKVEAPIEGWSPTWITALGNMGEDIQYLSSSAQARIFIDSWWNEIGRDENLVTLTLRHAVHNPARNYDPDTWGAFAQYLKEDGYFPVVVPDTEMALSKLPTQFGDVAQISEVAFNMELRVALYEKSYLNIFGLNGTAAVASFNKNVHFIQVKNPDHIGDVKGIEKFMGHRYGSCFPHINRYQRMVWQEPTLEILKTEFRSMASLIDAKTADGTYAAGLASNTELREPMIDLVRRFHRHDNWRQFEFAANWLLAKEPDLAELYYLIGCAEINQHGDGVKNEEKIRRAFERCVDLVDSSNIANIDIVTFKYWSNCLIYLGRESELMDFHRQKLRQIPDDKLPNLEAHFLSIAKSFEKNNQPAKAHEIYHMGFEKNVVSHVVYYRHCCQYFAQCGQIDEVLKHVKLLNGLSAISDQEIIHWASSFEKQDRPAPAAQLFRCAVDIDIISPEIIYRLGMLSKNLKQYDTATSAFEWLRDQGCQGLWVYQELSEIYMALDRFEEAKALLYSKEASNSQDNVV